MTINTTPIQHTKEFLAQRADQSLKCAERYIEAGLVIIKTHTPIFSLSGRVGCTCEEYYRSDKCRDSGHSKYDPNYVCLTPGKHPHGKWKDITDVMSRKMAVNIWGKTYQALDVDTGQKVNVVWNTGILTGPSNVLTLDADTYKDTYQCDLSDLIPPDDQETPQQLTHSGGLHLMFAREGKPYTNANGELVKAGINGVDIRGDGGFQVIEPSLGPSGNLYAWIEGYEPWAIKPHPIPVELDKLLASAMGKRSQPCAVKFTVPTTVQPDLAQWHLSHKVMDLLHNPKPKGDRSEADHCVVTALCYAGASDDAILAFFEHFPIGKDGKFAEAGRDYLERSIGKARSYVADNPHSDTDARVAPAPADVSTVDDVLEAITDIAGDQDSTPGERKRKIVNDLGLAIGEVDRTHHSIIVDTLATANAGFTKTDAGNFVRDCVADAKVRHKEEKQQRTQATRVALTQQRSNAGKFTIDISNRQLSDIAEDAMMALQTNNGAKPSTFVRSGALVRTVEDERGQYGIQDFNNRSMLGKLAAITDWERVSIDDNGQEKSQAVFPPADVVNIVLGAGEWPAIPALVGIVTSPVFSRDGVLHDQPGYDRNTKLFYTGGVKVGDTTPTHENIEHARDLILNNLLVDFPFIDEAGLAHAVAYMLLPFVRDMIDGPTPVHTVDSPTAGMGKGRLLNACAYPFMGHDVSTMAAARDDDEWRKRITTHLMGGGTHLVIDNVNHELDSGSLASAFTQPVWEDRTLGSNRDVKIPIRTIWGITANNIKMSQELARRCIWIRLDANVEKPWERTEFLHKNLIGWAKQHRDELVTGALTFIRAWVDTGMPLYTKRTKGSYESWAGVMGGILEAVGIPGFLDNETELYDRVVAKNDLLVDFVKKWWEKQQINVAAGVSDSSLSSYELFKLASYSDSDSDNSLGDWHDLLGDMLTSQSQRGRQIQLGKILDKNQDQVIAGFKVQHAKTANGSKYWHLSTFAGRKSPTDILPHSTEPLTPINDNNHTPSVECDECVLTVRVEKVKNYLVTEIDQNMTNNNNVSAGAAVVGDSIHSTNGSKSVASTGGSVPVECHFDILPYSTDEAVLVAASYQCQCCGISKWSRTLEIIRMPGGANVLCEQCLTIELAA